MAELFRILVVVVLLMQSVVGVIRPRCGVEAAENSACPCCTDEGASASACGMDDDSSSGCGCVRSTRGEPAPVPAAQDSRPVQDFVPSRAIAMVIATPVARFEGAGCEQVRRVAACTRALLCVWVM